MPTKESLITYQANSVTPCLSRLVARFGDRLESLTAIDKLDLIAILALWQSVDTLAQNSDEPSVSLPLFRESSLNDRHYSRNVNDFLDLIHSCSDGDAMTLLVTLPCQLRDGVFSE
jgi:hypothetical protein